MPDRPLKVEKLMNQTAKPAGSPFHSAISQNSRGWLAEQRRVDVGLGGFDFVQQLFVLGEFANQATGQVRLHRDARGGW